MGIYDDINKQKAPPPKKKDVVWSSDEVAGGSKAEEDLHTILRTIGVPEVSAEVQESDQTFNDVVFRRANNIEDTEKGIDFFFYNPKDKNWIAVDLTTARDHDVLNKKREKERKRGVRILCLPGRTLDQARRNCEYDIKKVVEGLTSVIFDSEPV